jgi:hypothetical protein
VSRVFAHHSCITLKRVSPATSTPHDVYNTIGLTFQPSSLGRDSLREGSPSLSARAMRGGFTSTFVLPSSAAFAIA